MASRVRLGLFLASVLLLATLALLAACAGPTGPAGAPGGAGLSGPAGATGSQGPQGPQGISGPEGKAGAAGAVGPTGAAGAAGVVGATGAAGVTGLAGATGAAGAAGATGPKGEPGATGPAGALVELNTLSAAMVAEAPVIDGVAEAVWMRATPLVARVANGANLSGGSTAVELRALYDKSNVYFLAQWVDPTESNERMPWQKQADGTWKQLKTSTTHQENTYYEDKFALIWNINIAGFEKQGCLVTCHPGEPAASAYGSKYALNAGEMGDIWHWKGVRTNPVGQIDDQYLDSKRAPESAEAGRHSDPKTAGGYTNNETADKKLPLYALKNNKPAPPFWILDTEKEAFADSKYAAGDKVPGIIVAPFTGDRGDIGAKGVWSNGQWTLEWARKLTTGSQYDVQFSDLNKAYSFGVAVFDNAQVNHAWSSGAYKVVFFKEVPAAPLFPPRIQANHAGRTTCRLCHEAGVAGAPKFPAAPNHLAVNDALATCQGCHQGP